jgi:formylmethanofuran dehydrogenase subunit C
MALVLTYHGQTAVPVEVEGILPSAVRGLALAEIERMEICHGKQKLPLAEMFRVSGDPSDGRMEWEGELSGVHWIGARLDGGEVLIRGNAGRHVGSEMTAGSIRVEGTAGDWLGGQMRGGTIYVCGSAGHLVGAAYRGSPRGMTGGTILVEGTAGNEVGSAMRRGLIVLGGAEDALGVNLIAGTILVFGPCGIRPGAGMRRGTIGLFGPETDLLPTFEYACRYRPPFFPLLVRELRQCGYPVPEGAITADVDLHHGDLVADGRGEILLRVQ